VYHGGAQQILDFGAFGFRIWNAQPVLTHSVEATEPRTGTTPSPLHTFFFPGLRDPLLINPQFLWNSLAFSLSRIIHKYEDSVLQAPAALALCTLTSISVRGLPSSAWVLAPQLRTLEGSELQATAARPHCK
jgi:hypothetical protein